MFSPILSICFFCYSFFSDYKIDGRMVNIIRLLFLFFSQRAELILEHWRKRKIINRGQSKSVFCHTGYCGVVWPVHPVLENNRPLVKSV